LRNECAPPPGSDTAVELVYEVVSQGNVQSHAHKLTHRILRSAAAACRRRVDAIQRGSCWLNGGVLDRARAAELVDGLDLDRVVA
jgi:hypothetical protein